MIFYFIRKPFPTTNEIINYTINIDKLYTSRNIKDQHDIIVGTVLESYNYTEYGRQTDFSRIGYKHYLSIEHFIKDNLWQKCYLDEEDALIGKIICLKEFYDKWGKDENIWDELNHIKKLLDSYKGDYIEYFI